MQIDMQRFHAVFFDETAEHLATMEESLLGLERTPEDDELLNRLFRAAHSIKGASGTFGFNDIAAFTHKLEGLLDRMRGGEIMATPVLIELLLRSADALGGLVAAAKDGGPLPAQVEDLITALEAARGGAAGPAAVAPPAVSAASKANGVKQYRVTFRPGRDILHFGMDPLLLLRDLARLGTFVRVTVDTSKLPDLGEMVPDECYLGWVVEIATDKGQDEIKGVFLFVEDCSEILIEEIATEQGSQAEQPAAPRPVSAASAGGSADAPRSQAPAQSRSPESSSIRVSVEKVDELINLVGELVISQSMVNQTIQSLPQDVLGSMQEALSLMNRSTRDLQERVMSVRMVPLANVFRRFPRLVRDLATTMGKQITVEIAGEETELDKQMTEQIVDPLTHMIRNSVDHGIEMPEDRVRAGKSPQGTITLCAYGEGGNVVIEVRDDGRGLDPQRIRQKAIAMGLIGAEDQLTDSQLHELILAPGFSTAEKVTDLSGRGVGMDVVKRNVESLNGSVRIESVLGQGTRIFIRLPLTMAIVDGLAAGLDEEIYIFPLLSVVKSFRPTSEEIRDIPGKGEIVMVQGRPVPLLRLYQTFNVPACVTDPTLGLVVVVEHQGKQFGLLVDELLGEMQVVMKSIETNYQKVDGIAAATILGDGQVAFILDVPGLGRLASGSR
jgi:two-component system chemotaxis sensor kinase CheA